MHTQKNRHEINIKERKVMHIEKKKRKKKTRTSMLPLQKERYLKCRKPTTENRTPTPPEKQTNDKQRCMSTSETHSRKPVNCNN